MTGFGAARVTVPGARVVVEVRSINHRFLETRVVLPREYARWERDLRDMIGAVVARGRVELTVNRTPTGSGKGLRVEVRRDVARAYVRTLRQLKTELKLAGEVDLRLLGGIPDLVRVSEGPIDAGREISRVQRAVRQALTALRGDRDREGAHLGRDMRTRVLRLDRIVRDVAKVLPSVVAGLQRRAAGRIKEISAGIAVDPQRLAQEAAILAERADVTEEIVRAGGHIAALRKLLATPGAVGKRIEFLIQEAQREINTIGAKAGDLRVSALALDAKAELEKLREQVQNVE